MWATKIVRRALPRRPTILSGTWAALVMGAVAIAAPQQHPAPVSEDDIERVRKSLPDVTNLDVEKAVQQHGRLPDAGREPARLSGPAPTIDNLPQPLTPARVDIGKLAEGFAATAPTAPGLRTTPQLVVFASFSMPKPTWARLMSQAERIGAPIVLRGLDQGSLRKTVARLHTLQGRRAANVQIDPQAFERYQISAVPTIILTKPNAGQGACGTKACADATTYAKVVGDVSIDYALERIEQRHPAFAREARALLTRLQAPGRP